jgi:pyrroline-5-carboxylate reductase
MTDASIADGIPRQSALSLASKFLRSASGLMADGMSPEEVKAALSTPKGITLNSVVQLEKSRVRGAIADSSRMAIAYADAM